MIKTLLLLALSVGLLGAESEARANETAAAREAIDFFEARVRPVLIDACVECHGAEQQESDLRLDSRAGLVEGGASGPAMVPGNPGESLLITAIRQTGDLQMPPGGKLSDEQIAALEEWVRLGAPWSEDAAPVDRREEHARTHWAFQAVERPAIPTVRHEEWVCNPVDSFILAALESKGLLPSPPVDRRTLIRRVTYDLTGLPPTAEEVEQFVNDPDPDAYEKLVERLLASPHYGEQWARHWLDVARYSDTKGYVYDREERFFIHAWAYRDWVVRAFNEDLPYDRFVLLQLAADRAAPDDRSTWAAMGYLTLGRRFLGVTHDIIDDRIDIVTRGLLGLTVSCARCHDHKFDPIPTEDYYSLYGVFRNCVERPVAIGDPSAQGAAREAFVAELAKREKAVREAFTASREEAAARVRARIGDYLAAQLEVEKFPEETFNQIYSTEDIIPEFVRRWNAFLEQSEGAADPVLGAWHRFAALPADEFSQRSATAAWEIAEDPEVNRLVRAAFREPPQSMREVAERYASLFKEIERAWQKISANEGAAALPDPAAEAVRAVLYGPGSPCEVPDEGILSTEQFFDTPTIERLWKLQGEVDRWLVRSPEAPPYAVTLVDRQLKAEPRVFRRGNPSNRGARVPRQFLALLSGDERQPFTDGSGRLEMAEAIVDPSNPLTPRVWANRVWQYHFGAGLVETPSDFGLRSPAPSHRELLDWLASGLVDHGWSTKWLHRQILLSATYQQRSDGYSGQDKPGRGHELDPDNHLLWRMRPRRLTFEQWRDTLLAASGELDRRLGGKPEALFDGAGPNRRRTLYGLVDRQFLDSALRMFDFANPDLHTPRRSETTVSPQALFALNHPFVAQQSRRLAARVADLGSDEAKVREMYRRVYQREPASHQLFSALGFLNEGDVEEQIPEERLAWQYGFGKLSEDRAEFHPLPLFTGSAWQGGPQWPDATLGWVQLSAEGGHAGNDLEHAAIRRWTAPSDTTISIASAARHSIAAGDGVRFWIVSSRHGILKSATLHNSAGELNVEKLDVLAGDTIDFLVDYNANLHSDEYLWSIEIASGGATSGSTEASSGLGKTWNSARDFAGLPTQRLSALERLAQVLLISNELMFVD